MAFKQAEVDCLLAATGRRCCICGELHGVETHHIIPITEGGTDDIDNAIPLCPNCHDEVHKGYIPGRVTRKYTPNELKLHRQRTIDAVKNGLLLSRHVAQTTNPAKAEAAQELSSATVRLCNNLQIFDANNFDSVPNEEWRQLRRELIDYSNDIATYEHMFGEIVVTAARKIHSFCHEILNGLSSGNAYSSSGSHIKGTEVRTSYSMKLTSEIEGLQSGLARAIRADLQ